MLEALGGNMNLDPLDPKEKQVMFLSVLNDWKASRSLILFEMLKQVAEPLIKNEIGKHVESGVRQEDLRTAAEAILIEALESYSSTRPETLVEWIQDCLTKLCQKIPTLQTQAGAQRGK
jgi:hypothetical protein